MPGDDPCNVRCGDRFCRYNQFGHCQDNYPCERLDGGSDKEKETEDGDEEA